MGRATCVNGGSRPGSDLPWGWSQMQLSGAWRGLGLPLCLGVPGPSQGQATRPGHCQWGHPLLVRASSLPLPLPPFPAFPSPPPHPPLFPSSSSGCNPGDTGVWPPCLRSGSCLGSQVTRPRQSPRVAPPLLLLLLPAGRGGAGSEVLTPEQTPSPAPPLQFSPAGWAPRLD